MTLSPPENRTRTTELAERVGAQTAALFADDVDRRSRFPVEAIDEIRAARLLSAMIPEHLGGSGAGLVEVADATFELARHCAVLSDDLRSPSAPSRLPVASWVERLPRAISEDVVSHQLLIASATAEREVRGDTSSSPCAIRRSNGRYNLEKFAPVISYGRYADAILLTARRTPESPPHDQVMVLCLPPGMLLEPTGEWNALGFRGTCSSGFRIVAEGDQEGILTDPFDVIAAQTNTPVAYILWAHVWLGLAAEATYRARAYVQSEGRKRPGETPGPARALARLDAVYMQMAALVREAARSHEATWRENALVPSIESTTTANAVKVSASTLVVEIVGQALRGAVWRATGRTLRSAWAGSFVIHTAQR